MPDFIHSSIIFIMLETLRQSATPGRMLEIYVVTRRTWVKFGVLL